MKYAKGVCWVDDTRIPFIDDVDLDKKLPKQDGGTIYGGGKGFYRTDEISEYKTGGRFTPSLLVCDDMLNDGVITQYNKTRKDKGNYLGGHRKEYVGTSDNDIVKQIKGQFFSDKGTNSRYYDLDKWFDKVINNL
jgi:hypothetical protein